MNQSSPAQQNSTEPTPKAETPQHPRDAALAQRAAAGDRAAFDHLYETYRQRVYAYALRRLRDTSDAEDVTQDVFLQAFRCLERYEGRSSLSTWLFGIAHHETCNRLRKRRANLTLLDDEVASTLTSNESSPEQRADARRTLSGCRRTLRNRLSEPQQYAFHLRYDRHHSVAEIARKMGRSTHAVKIGLFRTRRVLLDSTPELAIVASQ